MEALANFFTAAKRPDLALKTLEGALGRSPWEERPHLRAYQIYSRMATRPGLEVRQSDIYMNGALAALMGARKASPYDSAHYERLAILYHNWALSSPLPDARKLLAQESTKWFDAAMAANPQRSSLALRALDATMTLHKDTPHAETILRNILAHDPVNARAAEQLAYLCEYLAQKPELPPAQRQERRREAIKWANTALASPWRAYYKPDLKRLQKLADRAKAPPRD
jgi:hypothetical protein